MSILPAFTSVSGRGKPRLVVRKVLKNATSGTSTVYTSTTAQQNDGPTVNISSSSVANPTTIVTASAHGRVAGDWIRITGHTSTPDINGRHRVVDTPLPTSLRIDVNVTVGGGATGTVRETAAFAAKSVRAKMLVESFTVIGGQPNKPTWAKILSVDDANNILNIEEWYPTIPTDGQVLVVGGFVIDLPTSYELTETLTPNQLIQSLWRKRLRNKFYGWEYQASLDYALHIHADTLYDLQPAIGLEEEDELILIPHRDNQRYQYNVIYDGPFSVSLFGRDAGHKKPVFVFRGKELVPSWPLPASGYGFGYGENYGFQL